MAVDAYGPSSGLREVELPLPRPGLGEVRVRVHASAVNAADAKVITGAVKLLHAGSFPLVAGYDLSGVVDEVGEGVADLAVGDAVFGFHAYDRKTKLGAFAEHTVIGADMLAKKPDKIDHRTAAAAATPALTALQVFRDKAPLSSDGRAMVIGAAGGVGSVAVGIAKRLGAHVTAVCSTYAVDMVRGLGADRVVDRTKERFLDGEGGFDVVLDTPATYSFGACRRLLARGGTYVTLLPVDPLRGRAPLELLHLEAVRVDPRPAGARGPRTCRQVARRRPLRPDPRDVPDPRRRHGARRDAEGRHARPDHARRLRRLLR